MNLRALSPSNLMLLLNLSGYSVDEGEIQSATFISDSRGQYKYRISYKDGDGKGSGGVLVTVGADYYDLPQEPAAATPSRFRNFRKLTDAEYIAETDAGTIIIHGNTIEVRYVYAIWKKSTNNDFITEVIANATFNVLRNAPEDDQQAYLYAYLQSAGFTYTEQTD